MAALFADENFNFAAVQHLRSLGHDVATVQDVGMRGASDAAILTFADSANRAVLTFNRRHFIRLHLAGTKHSGIIACTDDAAIPLAERIHQALANLPTLANQLVRINRPP